MRVEKLAEGPGWSVGHIMCSSGPADRPFEEQHGMFCIAAVMQGSFQYRTTQGAATLVPGALLLGNHHCCFECGHDHGTGDRCVSFMFEPAYFESILSSVPGVRSVAFSVPRLPPMMCLTPLFADVAVAGADRRRHEQLALDLAGETVRLLAGARSTERNPTLRDERRVAAALRRIEASPDTPLSIGDLAREAAMSPYHFLRTFRRVAGVTPHQFILRTRLLAAAVALRGSSQPVIDIALGAGFADLSTFNRRFLGIMGMTPRAYRRSYARGLSPFSSRVSSTASGPPRASLSGPTLR